MRKFINHLRKKPEEERRHILHILTFIFAIFMIFLWTLTLSKNFTNTAVKENIKEDMKPFSVLKDNIFGIKEEIQKQANPIFLKGE